MRRAWLRSTAGGQCPRMWPGSLRKLTGCSPSSAREGGELQRIYLPSTPVDNEGDAQEHAEQQPEKAPSSLRLDTSSRGLSCGRLRPRCHLHLEIDRFQVAHHLRSAFWAWPPQCVRQPRTTDLVVSAQKHQSPFFSEMHS